MKKGIKKITWVVIVVMIVLLSLTALTAASDINWPWSSEPGTEPSVFEKAQPQNTELQPDDNGYTGPITEANQVEIAPSGDEPMDEVDWDALIPEDAPDQKVTTEDPNWTGFYYYHAAGSALHPRDSSVGWNTGGSGGCLYLTSGSPAIVFNLHADIPNGARIDYLRIYYYDTSASDTQSWVTRYDDAGGIEDVAYVASAGTAGYGTRLSPLIEHVVDSVNYSYILNWRPVVAGTSMYLCGLRVAYMLP